MPTHYIIARADPWKKDAPLAVWEYHGKKHGEGLKIRSEDKGPFRFHTIVQKWVMNRFSDSPETAYELYRKDISDRIEKLSKELAAAQAEFHALPPLAQMATVTVKHP